MAWRVRTRKIRAILNAGPICRVCQRDYTAKNPPTFDHIIMKTKNGRKVPENLRVMCRECNNLIGVADGCVGFMACGLAVAEDEDRNPRRLIWQWLNPDRLDSKREAMRARKRRQKKNRRLREVSKYPHGIQSTRPADQRDLQPPSGNPHSDTNHAHRGVDELCQ
jgi:hypothetical protein